MSFLGSLLGGLFSYGNSAASSALQYAMSQAGQKRQYEYQRKLNIQQNDLQKSLNQWNAQNIPLYSRQGMESAGFNPILAISSGSAFSAGGNAQGGSAASSNPVQAPDFNGALDSAVNAYKTLKLEENKNEADIDYIRSLISNTNAKTVSEEYNQNLMHSQQLLNQINTELAKKDLSWKDRLYLMQEKTGYMNAAAAHLGAEAQQMNANTAKQHFQLDKEMQTYEKDFAKRYMEFGKKHPYVRDVNETVGRFFKGFSANYSKK